MQKSKSVQRSVIQQPKKPIKTKSTTPTAQNYDFVDRDPTSHQFLDQAYRRSEKSQNDYLKSFIASSLEQMNPNDQQYSIRRPQQLDPQVQEALLESQSQRANLINSIMHPKSEPQSNNTELLRRLSILENQMQNQRQNYTLTMSNSREYDSQQKSCINQIVILKSQIKFLWKLLKKQESKKDIEKILQKQQQADMSKLINEQIYLQSKEFEEKYKILADKNSINERKLDRLVEIIRKQKDKLIEVSQNKQENSTNNEQQKFFTQVQSLNNKIIEQKQHYDLYLANINEEFNQIKQDQSEIIQVYQQHEENYAVQEQQLLETTTQIENLKVENSNMILLLNQNKKLEPNNDLDQIKAMLLEEIIPQIEQLQTDVEDKGNLENQPFNTTVIKTEQNQEQDDKINQLYNLQEETQEKLNIIQAQLTDKDNQIKQILDVKQNSILDQSASDTMNNSQVIFTQLISLSEEKDEIIKNLALLNEQTQENKIRIENMELLSIQIKDEKSSEFKDIIKKTNAVPIILENLDKINTKLIEFQTNPKTEQDHSSNIIEQMLILETKTSNQDEKVQQLIQELEEIKCNQEVILIFEELQKQIQLIQDKTNMLEEVIDKQMTNDIKEPNSTEKYVQESVAFMMNQIEKIKEDFNNKNQKSLNNSCDDNNNFEQYIKSLPVQDLSQNQEQINEMKSQLHKITVQINELPLLQQEVNTFRTQFQEIQQILDQLEQNYFQIQSQYDIFQQQIDQQNETIDNLQEHNKNDIIGMAAEDEILGQMTSSVPVEFQNSIQQLSQSLTYTEDKLHSLEKSLTQFKPEIRRIERNIEEQQENESHVTQKLSELHERMDFMQLMFQMQQSSGPNIDIEGVKQEYEKMEQRMELSQPISLPDADEYEVSDN